MSVGKRRRSDREFKLGRLRRQLAEATEECDTLRKALDVFSRSPK